MTAAEIQNILARQVWPWHRHVVVPNVRDLACYGEADLVILRQSGYMEEVEIKVSRADFRREFETKHDKHMRLALGKPDICSTQSGNPNYRAFDPENPLHFPEPKKMGQIWWFHDYSKPEKHRIRRFWFAMPYELAETCMAEVAELSSIPEHAGLIAVKAGYGNHCRILKDAPILKHSRKLTDEERIKIMRLAYMRYWMHRVPIEGKEVEAVLAR